MTTLTEFEPFVDKTILALASQLDAHFAITGLPCNIATWLQYCMFSSSAGISKLTRVLDAFDAIGELTFSKSLGFLDQGRDIDGIIKALEKTFDYSGKVCSSFQRQPIPNNDPRSVKCHG